jgi:hypothetical protein
VINYQTVDFLADQLRQQYDTQVAAGLDPLPVEEQVPGFFRAQAAKLAANGVQSIYDIQQADGGIVNMVTGEPIKGVVLRSNWETNPEAYRFRDPVELEERGGGKYTRWGKDVSITGQGDYGISFVDNKPVFTPYWKDTKNFDVGDAMKTAAAIAAVYYGGSYLLGGETAAAGATTAGAGTGTGISGAGLTSAEMAALKGAEAYGSLGAPISTAVAVPASQLAYPATQIGAGATPVPGSFQAALGELGVQTAATTAPATAAAGSFQAALPSLLAPAATSSIGLTDALRAANSVRSLLTPQQQMGLPQQGLLGGGGGQARGVDFSPLYQNTTVGLLPGAELFRRSLI